MPGMMKKGKAAKAAPAATKVNKFDLRGKSKTVAGKHISPAKPTSGADKSPDEKRAVKSYPKRTGSSKSDD